MTPPESVAKIDVSARLITPAEWNMDLQRRLGSVQKEIVLAISDPVHTEYAATGLLLRDGLAAGNRVRILVSPEYVDSRKDTSLRPEGLLNDRIRVSYTEFHNAMIVDGCEAVVWECTDGGPRVYPLTGGNLPKSIGNVVTRAWSAGLPLRAHIDLRRKEFDSIAIAIMRSLSAGATDEVAARQLSVSPRTYRRHVANIMDRLDITTRFQLGARAAELGLLS